MPTAFLPRQKEPPVSVRSSELTALPELPEPVERPVLPGLPELPVA